MHKVVQGNLVDVFLGKTYPAEIWIDFEGRIHKIERVDKVFSNFILPPFVDAHIHIESSLLVPEKFAEVAVHHGTVAVVSDPHEIANVCGLEGVYRMVDHGRQTFLKFFWTAPSCVPATAFESAGAKIGVKELENLFQIPTIVALGEMMNFPGVIQRDTEVIEKCRTALDLNLVIDGHAPGLSGVELEKYVQAGITTDHECVNIQEAIEKIHLGMQILIREGSSARNFESLASLINLYPENVMLCSDDLHADDLLKGHLNILIKRALAQGQSIYNVLRAVSINPILHYKLDVGMIREGDWADFVLVDNLTELNVLETWINGKNVLEEEERGPVEFSSLNNFNASLVDTEDLKFKPTSTICQIIDVEEGSLLTGKSKLMFQGEFEKALKDHDLLKLYVKDRYNNGYLQKAIVRGFGSLQGALVTSIAHDSHNIIALGFDEEDVKSAINLLIENKGGITYVNRDRQIYCSLPLPFGGLMSYLPATQVARQYEEILELVRLNGCRLNSPIMTLSFLSLLVIPSLKLSDRGLFDGDTFQFTPLFLNQ